MAPHNAHTEAILSGPSTHLRLLVPFLFPPLTVSQPAVFKAVQRFRKGSAGGLSGLRPEHVKLALKDAPARRERALASLPGGPQAGAHIEHKRRRVNRKYVVK